MPSLRISTAAARRITRLARRRKRTPQRVLETALRAGLDYEEWFQAEVAKGLADLDSGNVISHHQVLKDVARRKAMLARALKKAA